MIALLVGVLAFLQAIGQPVQAYLNKEADYFWGENARYENLTIKFESLSFRVVCEPEDWRPEFNEIRNKLAKCLKLEKIILEDEEDDEEEKNKRDLGLIFGDINSNFYCRNESQLYSKSLAKNWKKCYKYLENQDCLEPDADSLNQQRMTKLKEIILKDYPVNTLLDQYDWRTMTRPYKVMCELAKLQFQASPFGPSKGIWF